MTALVADHQLGATSNITDQSILDKNLTSNQSSDKRESKKLKSEEVQLLEIIFIHISPSLSSSHYNHIPIDI